MNWSQLSAHHVGHLDDLAVFGTDSHAPIVAAELCFCPLLHIDRFKMRNNTLPGLFDLSTVCVHNKQLHFKADRGPFVLIRFSEQNEHRINV